MQSDVLDAVARRDLTGLPARYRDYAYASLARAACRLGVEYRVFLEAVGDPYMRAYVLAELPSYDRELFEHASRRVLAEVPRLSYLERVFVLSRLSETAFQLGGREYRDYLDAARGYAASVGYSGRARLALAMARCGDLEAALKLASLYSGSRRASLLVELALSRPGDRWVARAAVEAVEGLRSARRKLVLFSRLVKHPMYSELGAVEPREIAARVPLGRSLQDAYLSLVVARNLGEAGFLRGVEARLSEVLYGAPPLDVLPLDFAEVLLEVLYHVEGLTRALEVAGGVELAPVYAAHLLDYASSLSLAR